MIGYCLVIVSWCLIISILVFGICLAPVAQAAVMSSSSYKIQIDSINTGGVRGTSSNYALQTTIGESGTGRITGTSNNLYAGFQLPSVAATPSPSSGAGVSSAGTRRAQGQLLNVENFTVRETNQQIQLQWNNPADIDFAGARIMRSEEFYPSDPGDGVLIYSGIGQEFLDTGLQNGKLYYYTAFAYDQFGNFASGAVASAIPQAPGFSLPIPLPPTQPPLVPPGLIPPSLKDLSLLDFDFIQNGSKLPVINGRIEIEQDSPFTIAIDYDKLPEVLKTILATMENDKGEVFSFLLRVDGEKQRYLATLNPPTSGAYSIGFIIVDYQNQGLQKVEGELQVQEAVGSGSPAPPGPAGKGISSFLPELLIFLLIALLLLAVMVWSKKVHVNFK